MDLGHDSAQLSGNAAVEEEPFTFLSLNFHIYRIFVNSAVRRNAELRLSTKIYMRGAE